MKTKLVLILFSPLILFASCALFYPPLNDLMVEKGTETTNNTPGSSGSTNNTPGSPGSSGPSGTGPGTSTTQSWVETPFLA